MKRKDNKLDCNCMKLADSEQQVCVIDYDCSRRAFTLTCISARTRILLTERHVGLSILPPK